MAEYSVARFYQEDGTTLIAEEPNVPGMSIPTAPTVSGKTFVCYGPPVDDTINGVSSIKVTVSGTEYTDLTGPVRSVDSNNTYLETYTKTIDANTSLTLVVGYSTLYPGTHTYEVTYKNTDGEYESETESFSTVGTEINLELEGHDDIKCTVSFTQVGTSGNVNYYAMYRAETHDPVYVRFWHYTSSLGVVEDKKTTNIAYGTQFSSDMEPTTTPTLDGAASISASKWTCTWTPTPPATGTSLVSNWDIEGVFTSKQNLKVTFGDSSIAETAIQLTWNRTYANITPPSRAGYVFGGANLYYKESDSATEVLIVQTHDKDGYGIATCNTNGLVSDIGTSKYYIRAFWYDTKVVVTDLESLRESIQDIPSPFATAPSATSPIIDATPFLGTTSSAIQIGGAAHKSATITIGSGSVTAVSGDYVEHNEKLYQYASGAWNRVRGISFQTGFNSDFTRTVDELESTGRVMTRRMLNSLGNIGSQCQFFEQCGGFYTFDPKLAASVGGYPKGAFLNFYDEDEAVLRTVVSVKDNNSDNFLTDKSFINGTSWKYVDDNPEVSMMVDYSDYEDVADALFVSTGLADVYEVPYDAYLQMFAIGYIECMSLSRDEIEDMVIALEYPVEGEETEEANVNGMYWSSALGSSYLDVYSQNSDAFSSSIIGGWAPFSFAFSNLTESAVTTHIECVSPISPFSIGIQLNKGDKIRIRNSIVSKKNVGNTALGYPKGFVHSAVFGDKKLKRTYTSKFAHLYRRTTTI